MDLTIGAAKEFVRARLDELSQTSSDMLSDSLDDRNLGLTVEKALPEAITRIHISAPAALMEGQSITGDTIGGPTKSASNGVLDINFAQSDLNVLRLLSFSGGTSPYVLSSYFEEDSPQGRMQNDPYVKGMPDNPILIKCADSSNYKPHFKYYTLASGDTADFHMSFIPVPTATGTGDNAKYSISPNLEYAVLNELTAIVCAAYGYGNQSQYYSARAQEYINK